jgi:dienelactone hydrolase
MVNFQRYKSLVINKIDMKTISIIIIASLTVQISYGQRKIDKVADLNPVKESYLLSGKLDSSQYKYFLNGILKEQFDRRRDTLKKILRSRDMLIQHIKKIKNEYLSLLGPMPEKTPLKPVVTGTIKKDNYRVEKVAFESRPDHHVTALLYIPEGEGPFPAILHMPGHSYTAKGRDFYQTIGRYFALNGFVVLQVDPVGQGERCQICQDTKTQYFDNARTPMVQNTTGQHELYNQGLLMLGSGVVAWEIWDNIRSIDYLCSRPEVDTAKIGITGLSGGGNQTTYLASMDKRIKVAVPSSYIATTEEKFRTIGSQDGCQQLYSEGKLGIEEQDFLSMAFPVPILILSTYSDFFSYKGSVTAADELRKMYQVLGSEGKTKQFAISGDHDMPAKSREANVKWMSWWLKGDSSRIIPDTLTGDFIPLEETFVTATGQVMSYFKNEKSILDYSVEMMDKCKKNKTRFLSACNNKELADKAAELTGYENPDGITGGNLKGTFLWEGLNIEKHLVNRDRGFGLPALIIRPASRLKTNKPAIILSGSFGKMKELSDNRKLISEKLKYGYTVMIIDVTNTGELRTPEAGRDLSYEFSVGKMLIYAGKTLLGYRAEDLVIAKNYLVHLGIADSKGIELLASGQIAPCAIHAAFIDGGFSKLWLRDSPQSWETLVRTHFKPDNIGIIVPDVLNYYDLPDLIQKTPIPVEIIQPAL